MKGASDPKKHLFVDCESIFSKKLHSFHDQYVDDWLLLGVSLNHTSLDSVKMTKNPKFKLLYFKRIVGGIMANKPLIKVLNIKNEEILSSCEIFYLNNYSDIEDFYMLQKVYNWKHEGMCCQQVWQLKITNLFDANNHWF